MGRRGLVIALAAFLVIAVGAGITFAIVSSQGGSSAAPSPQPTGGSSSPSASATPTASPVPTVTSSPGTPPPAAVTSLAATPTPRTVQLTWAAPTDADLETLVVVRSPGAVVPTSPETGTIVAAVPPSTTTVLDAGAGLVPGGKFTYGVFVRNVAGVDSPVSAVSVTLPAALTITPVDLTGEVTQLAVDAPLSDTGSLAFTAFTPTGPRTVVVSPGTGATGALTTVLTEPAGSAPGAVAWTYTVPNAALRSLAEGAKRDEVFVLELRDGPDRLPATVTMTLRGINDAPVVAAPMPGQAGIAGQPFTFPIPVGTFADVDATDTLTLTAGTLPGWLSFVNDQLVGNPGGGDTGSTTVTVTATDPHGVSVSADVTIEVAVPLPAPNQPPVPVADAVTFDLGVDPLQTTANVLANDTDPDAGPNALAVVPASFEWQVNGELAGTYTLDAAGELVLDSGIDADGPLQRLGAGEQVTATLSYDVTDGTDTVTSNIEVTVIGPPTKDGEYGVNKVFVPPAEPGRELGPSIHR